MSIHTIPYPTQVADTEDGLRAIAIRNPHGGGGEVPEFVGQMDLLDDDAVAGIGDFSGKDGCFFISFENFLE
jgi:hypothetical protein